MTPRLIPILLSALILLACTGKGPAGPGDLDPENEPGLGPGASLNGAPNGIPYVVVSGSQNRVPVSFYYEDESDTG